MSAVEEDDNTVLCCASCGIAGGDDIKLNKCACKLVKYCSMKCQKDHRKQHKQTCKKRVDELRDEMLFKQPESTHLGDCPICCVPLPLDPLKSGLYLCCSKQICTGCDIAQKRIEAEGGLQSKCPFCRNTMPKTEEERNEQKMKRIEANDPVALREMGNERYEEGDFKSALEYWSKAAALGDLTAHYHLSILYRDGEGVEKDEKKELYHLKEAVIGGNPNARHNLGCIEGVNGRHERAIKHFTIAAKQGYDDSLEELKGLYKAGLMSKDDFAAALRGHHAAIGATKSPQREEAAVFWDYVEDLKSGRAQLPPSMC